MRGNLGGSGLYRRAYLPPAHIRSLVPYTGQTSLKEAALILQHWGVTQVS